MEFENYTELPIQLNILNHTYLFFSNTMRLLKALVSTYPALFLQRVQLERRYMRRHLVGAFSQAYETIRLDKKLKESLCKEFYPGRIDSIGQQCTLVPIAKAKIVREPKKSQMWQINQIVDENMVSSVQIRVLRVAQGVVDIY